MRAPGVSTAGLLARPERVVYGVEAHDAVAGRRVLVTGGGGSIGSELVRQLHRLDPAAVYVLDHDESLMHALQLELRGDGLLDDDRMVLADVRDRNGMTRIISQVAPEIVFHAAAHKHVPVLERYPAEAVKTNLLGTDNVAAACVRARVRTLVNVSTDKAARPTSVLGMTKRLAEQVVAVQAGTTRTASVRFGNVLGSRGSLLDSLDHQLTRGISVTVTHPAATRYFMTIPEAAGLVIEAAAMAQAGETYVLDMGEPVPVVEVVRRYAAALGLPAPEVRITGLRPGEKLHEQLYDAAEHAHATRHPRISAVEANVPAAADLRGHVNDLYALADAGETDELRARLAELVPVADPLELLVPA